MPDHRTPTATPSAPPAAASPSTACDTGVCGSDVPPLVGSVLTGSGLTLAQAAARLLQHDDPLPQLTDVQRRLVHEHALTL